jgi:hypothetical protein
MPPVTDELQETIRDHYQHGRGSIQDYARIYHLSVEQVLEIVGETDLGSVSIGGDLIDAAELGKNSTATVNPPQQQDVPFDLR